MSTVFPISTLRIAGVLATLAIAAGCTVVSGYDEGHKKGHAEGYADGHRDGLTSGRAEAQFAARCAGWNDGHFAGFAEGEQHGYVVGFTARFPGSNVGLIDARWGNIVAGLSVGALIVASFLGGLSLFPSAHGAHYAGKVLFACVGALASVWTRNRIAVLTEIDDTVLRAAPDFLACRVGVPVFFAIVAYLSLGAFRFIFSRRTSWPLRDGVGTLLATFVFGITVPVALSLTRIPDIQRYVLFDVLVGLAGGSVLWAARQSLRPAPPGFPIPEK